MYPSNQLQRTREELEQQGQAHNEKLKGRKGLEHNITIKVPNPLHVIQLAQQFGISAWEEDGACVLSGIDEVEIGRFLRQYKIMDDAQVAVLFGGRLAGHKSLETKGKKAMEIHVKDSSDKEEKEEQEQPQAQDETPADQSAYTENPEESYNDDNAEQYEESEEGYEDEGPQEKLGAQILRELHTEMEEFLSKYDEILPLVEHEGVSERLLSKLENTASELEEIEVEFGKLYPEYGGLGGDKELEEGGPAPEHEEEGASSEGLPEPSPDEVVEGMSKHPDDEEETEEENPLPTNKKSLETKNMKPQLKSIFSLLNHEQKSIVNAKVFLKTLGSTKALDEDLKFDSHFHAKTLNMIQNRIDKVFGETMAGAKKKGSLLPTASGDAAEGEDQEVDVNKPSGPSRYTPGKEPMQQHGKGSLLDSYKNTGDAGDALGDEKDTDSHINEPTSPNAHVKPGEDTDHMSYGHDGEWPHKGSLLPSPNGDAGEGEPEEVNVNHPSSNPQAKPGTDKEKMGFGHDGSWPHKELSPGGQLYKTIAGVAEYLKSLTRSKTYGDSLRGLAIEWSKALDGSFPLNEWTSAVNVTKPAGWNPSLGQDEQHQPFGKDAQWPTAGGQPQDGQPQDGQLQGEKSLGSILTSREKKLDAMKNRLDSLVNLLRKS